MAESREDEIYSTMFSSLKHPVRRKILRMLGSKSMTFMEMVEELGVSSPHLTYHLESLGELVSKLDDGKYKLSAFGQAAVTAMKGVEETHEAEPKRRLMTRRWKTIIVALLVAVVLLSAVTVVQIGAMHSLSNSKNSLSTENQQLLAWGVGQNQELSFLQNVTQIDTPSYAIAITSNTLTWRTDFGGLLEGLTEYSLTSGRSNLNVELRYRSNHFSMYTLTMVETSPTFSQAQPDSVLQNAKNVLARYQQYSGDAYLANMTSLLGNVTTVNNTSITQGNMNLQITATGDTVTFLWCYTQNGINYQAKGLEMIFTNNVLTYMEDGYFLFTIGNTNLATSENQAVSIAENYVKTMSYNIGGQEVSGFDTMSQPISVQLVPQPRGDSVALIPYWYVELGLTQVYAGGYNEVGIGIYADTGQVSDVQLLSGPST